jgi:DNA-directed RNA polymerase sigma subunit (sigma70/sigma32)
MILADKIDQQITDNVGLAYPVARRYQHRCTAGFDFEDLRQEAIIGLQTAARKFDPSRGVKI